MGQSSNNAWREISDTQSLADMLLSFIRHQANNIPPEEALEGTEKSLDEMGGEKSAEKMGAEKSAEKMSAEKSTKKMNVQKSPELRWVRINLQRRWVRLSLQRRLCGEICREDGCGEVSRIKSAEKSTEEEMAGGNLRGEQTCNGLFMGDVGSYRLRILDLMSLVRPRAWLLDSCDQRSREKGGFSQIKTVRRHTKGDGVMQELKKTIQQGWPERQTQVKREIRDYYSVRDQMAVDEDIIYKGVHNSTVQNCYFCLLHSLVHREDRKAADSHLCSTEGVIDIMEHLHNALPILCCGDQISPLKYSRTRSKVRRRRVQPVDGQPHWTAASREGEDPAGILDPGSGQGVEDGPGAALKALHFRMLMEEHKQLGVTVAVGDSNNGTSLSTRLAPSPTGTHGSGFYKLRNISGTIATYITMATLGPRFYREARSITRMDNGILRLMVNRLWLLMQTLALLFWSELSTSLARKLTWHNDGISDRDTLVWIKILGDHGGGSFKMAFQPLNKMCPNSKLNTIVCCVFKAKGTRENIITETRRLVNEIKALQVNTWRVQLGYPISILNRVTCHSCSSSVHYSLYQLMTHASFTVKSKGRRRDLLAADLLPSREDLDSRKGRLAMHVKNLLHTEVKNKVDNPKRSLKQQREKDPPTDEQLAPKQHTNAQGECTKTEVKNKVDNPKRSPKRQREKDPPTDEQLTPKQHTNAQGECTKRTLSSSKSMPVQKTLKVNPVVMHADGIALKPSIQFDPVTKTTHHSRVQAKSCHPHIWHCGQDEKVAEKQENTIGLQVQGGQKKGQRNPKACWREKTQRSLMVKTDSDWRWVVVLLFGEQNHLAQS
uniref:Uncharacterized protein n=1 Tax=Branchiostoma floridae TaxID=7739 RepID=C3XT27_BRAFL|eukprot:XP_002612751.1 hypothetical protein BRAFLDRAFT_97269 [Branchiostoma floridae]